MRLNCWRVCAACCSVFWRPYRVSFCLLEVLEVLEALDVPEVMCCALLCILEAVEGGLCLL